MKCLTQHVKSGFVSRNANDHFKWANLERKFCGDTCGVRNLSNFTILNVKYFGL